MRSDAEKVPTRAVEYLIAKGKASAPFTDDDQTVSRIVLWEGGFARVSTAGAGWRLMGRQRSMAIPRRARLLSKSEARQITESSSPATRTAHEARAEKLAAAGQGGDTDVAHVTPGEVVVPLVLQTPEVLSALRRAARAQGIDLRRFTVGKGRINPKTGQEQFDLDTYWLIYPGGDYPGRNGMATPIPDLRPRLPDPRDVVPGGQGGGQSDQQPGGQPGQQTGQQPGGQPDDPLNGPPGDGHGLLPSPRFQLPEIPFGPPPADWSNRRDPFGIMRRFEPPPMRLGRLEFDGYQDQAFDAAWRRRAYEAGFDPDHLTPEQQATFFGAPEQSAEANNQPQYTSDGSESRFSPQHWLNRWAKMTDAEVGQDFMTEFSGGDPDATGDILLGGQRASMINALKQKYLTDPGLVFKPGQSFTAADVALLQDIHPEDLGKGTLIGQTTQELFERTEMTPPEYFIGADGNAYTRTPGMRTHENPIAGLFSTLNLHGYFNPNESWTAPGGQTLGNAVQSRMPRGINVPAPNFGR